MGFWKAVGTGIAIGAGAGLAVGLASLVCKGVTAPTTYGDYVADICGESRKAFKSGGCYHNKGMVKDVFKDIDYSKFIEGTKLTGDSKVAVIISEME